MSKIVFFKDKKKVYDGTFEQIGLNQVRITFDSTRPSDDILLSGFNLVNEYNGYIQTIRDDYKFIYRTYEDNELIVELCNDGVEYAEPEPPEEIEIGNLSPSLRDVLIPTFAGISPNTAYVELKTTNAARKYVGLNLAVIGGSFQVTTQIPARTIITLATVGQLIKPIAQHNVNTSNDCFIQTACWIGVGGTICFYAQSAIPVQAYIHIGDCYVYADA
ncbi:MAG: hypothetical protein HDR24_09320 [Lachnospiraceae bacterium]|nr:hypothetical protein [Lachnospiraceae bacterium]